MNKYERRVAGADWDAVAASVDDLGCALLPQLLTPAEAARIAGMYDDVQRFRATIDMARHRFGEGQYRYFDRPFPEAVEALRQALYPRLLPIAREWYSKLGREAEWPDTLDEWLDVCHRAGQTRPTPILLRYGAGDWNALHRDLYGDKVFPLQVVINLERSWCRSHWRRVPAGRAAAAGAVTGYVDADPAGARVGVHDSRSSGEVGTWVVGCSGAAWRVHNPFRTAPHPRTGLPRREMSARFGSSHIRTYDRMHE